MYGWELVNSVSAQGGESTITITGIDTNDVYALVMYDIWMTADARPRYRFTSSGSQDSGSNYKYSSEDAYSNGSLSVSKYNIQVLVLHITMDLHTEHILVIL